MAGLQQGQKLDKIWRAAIRRAVSERIEDEEGEKGAKAKALHLLARKLVKTGLKGDVSALKEIGDRLDGKPAQSVDLAMNVQVTEIKRVIVDPAQVIDVDCEVVEPEPVKAIEST